MSLQVSRSAEGTPNWAPASLESVFSFGPFELDAARRVLLRDGRAVPLTARGFDLLLILIRNRHRMLSRAELMHELWPNVYVEDGNLSVNMSLIRKALGENTRTPRYVATLPRRGYRFVAEVKTPVPKGSS